MTGYTSGQVIQAIGDCIARVRELHGSDEPLVVMLSSTAYATIQADDTIRGELREQPGYYFWMAGGIPIIEAPLAPPAAVYVTTRASAEANGVNVPRGTKELH